MLNNEYYSKNFWLKVRINNCDFYFIIVSEKFKWDQFIFRASGLYDLWDSPVDIEPWCYTIEEFERKKKQRGVVAQAVKEGIEIKAS